MTVNLTNCTKFDSSPITSRNDLVKNSPRTSKLLLMNAWCQVGRLSFKQFHKDKPTKWGIKVWMLADSKTGYSVSFDVYTDKDADLDTLKNEGKVSGIVLNLAESLYIFFDHVYTSPNVLFWLRRVDLSGCGTVLTNRAGFPKQLKSPDNIQGDYSANRQAFLPPGGVTRRTFM